MPDKFLKEFRECETAIIRSRMYGNAMQFTAERRGDVWSTAFRRNLQVFKIPPEGGTPCLL